MRTVLALAAVAATMLARDPAATATAKSACGPKDVDFDVQEDKSPQAVRQPEPGKALIYVIQDQGKGGCQALAPGMGCITTKLGMDGVWLGANRHNSYLAFMTDPGERHLCAIGQGRGAADFLALAHVNAEAGKIYYFRVRPWGGGVHFFLDLDPIDSDEGKYLLASYPLSVWRRKN